MKIAISGKGGVGKSTLAGALSLMAARQGQRVLAVDADPDANLASALGIPREKQQDIIPISRQAALIEERTGAKVNQYGQIFKLNPEVSDIAESQAYLYNGVALLVLGAVEKGGSGCACPENVLLRSLVNDLILVRNETLIMDMEAGVEHLGRATAQNVDHMLVVVEPGQRSIDTAFRVRQMADDLGLKTVSLVANKIRTEEDADYIRQFFKESELLGEIPYSESIRQSDRDGMSVLDALDAQATEAFTALYDRVLGHT